MGDAEIQTVKSGRGLRIALAVSVALNLAVVGMVAGAFFHNDGGPGARGSVRDLGFGPYTEALNREERAALRQAFLANAPDLRATRDAVRTDMKDVLAALRAEPFDAGKLTSALKAQSNRLARQLETGQQLMSDFFAKMTPTARLDFADRLEAGLRRKPKP